MKNYVKANQEFDSYNWLKEDMHRVLSELSSLCDELGITNIVEFREFIDEVISEIDVKRNS